MKILMWGTGAYADFFLKETGCINSICGFISNKVPDELFQKKYTKDKFIYSSSQLNSIKFDIIIIAILSDTAVQEIYQEIEKMNIDKGKIVIAAKLFSIDDTFELNESELFIYNICKDNYKFSFAVSSFIDNWRQYYYQNKNIIFNKINSLKNNMDNESKISVDFLTERNFKILPLQDYDNYFLWNYKKLLNQEEQQILQNAKQWEAAARKKYSLNNTLPVEVSVFQYDCGLSFLPANIINNLKGKDFIDGGAYWGDSALVLSGYSPKSIHSFELMPENFSELQKNIENMKMNRVIPKNLGLGRETNDKIDCYYNEQSISSCGIDGSASIHCISDAGYMKKISMSFTTIDDYAKENNLDVGLIKLDVEGNELDTIIGSINTIKAYKPTLLLSIYHRPEDLLDIKPMIENLNMDYKFMVRHLSFRPNLEYMLIAY